MRLYQFSPYKILKYKDIVNNAKEYIDNGLYYPKHVKIDLTEICNHRCIFCFYGEEHRNEGIERKNISKGFKSIPFDILDRTLRDLKENGTEAVTLIGGGEPLMHPNIKDILKTLNEIKLSFGVVSNFGRDIDDEFMELLSNASWLRASIDSIDEEMYDSLHKPKNPNVDNFNHTLDNLKRLLKVRKNTVVGVSFLIHPINYKYMITFTRQMKNLGVNYVEFKPIYTDKVGDTAKQTFPEIKSYADECMKYADSDFKVIPLLDRMSDSTFVTRDYDKCKIHYFDCHIGADARVYPCCVLAYSDKHEFGSLKEKSFKEIWNSSQRQKIIEKLSSATCPRCWADSTNSILEYLTIDEEIHEKFV